MHLHHHYRRKIQLYFATHRYFSREFTPIKFLIALKLIVCKLQEIKLEFIAQNAMRNDLGMSVFFSLTNCCAKE